MNCIDLTLTEEDNILYVKKSKNDESFDNYAPDVLQVDNDIFNFFYGTEDQTEKYLSIQHPINRKMAKPNYSIKCPKCHEYFINCNFLNHIIDHYKIEYSQVDRMLLPKIASLSNSIYNDMKIHQPPLTTPRSCHNFCCEICCLDFDSAIGLGQHLETKHVHQDMPYVCFICNFFCTSFLSKLKQHFYDRHKLTEFLICPFCIQPFELSTSSTQVSKIPQNQIECPDNQDGSLDTIKNGDFCNQNNFRANQFGCPSNIPVNGSLTVNDGQATDTIDSVIVLNAIGFVVHLEKHLLKKQFLCDKCMLKFTTKLTLIFHKVVYHQGREINLDSVTFGNGRFLDLSEKSMPSLMNGSIGLSSVGDNNNYHHTQQSHSQKKIIKTSLNVTNRPVNVMKLRINSFRLAMVCAECRESLSSFPSHTSMSSLSSLSTSYFLAHHFQSFSMCTQCGFRSYCAASFKKHTRTFHTQIDSLNYKSIDIYQKGVLICQCGYQSMHGDGLASHLCRCSYKTCYTRPRIFNKRTGLFKRNRSHRKNENKHDKENDKIKVKDNLDTVTNSKNVKSKTDSKAMDYFAIVNLGKLL